MCGGESNALQAIAQLARLQPDLAIVEYEGHGMDGLELAAQLGRLRRTLAVMLYTANTFPSAFQRIVPSEVPGAVLKTEPRDELALGLETIRRVHHFRSGEITPLCQQAEEQLRRTDPLSASELEVLQLTSVGKATKEIAEHRGVSIKTIEVQQRSIRQKLRVPCAPAAVGWPCATASSAESVSGPAADRIMIKRKTNGPKRTPAFVARVERAFARVAHKVRAESSGYASAMAAIDTFNPGMRAGSFAP